MIFQFTWHLILAKRKTQTSRIAKPDEYGTQIGFFTDELGRAYPTYSSIHHASQRTKWRVGGIYAVQKNRGKKGIAQIKIVRIWERYPIEISWQDAKKEGFENRSLFLEKWDEIHGKDKQGVKTWVLDFEIMENPDSP